MLNSLHLLSFLFLFVFTPSIKAVHLSNGDVTIRFIKRLPELDYIKYSSQPDIDGWPVIGQEVTWRAYIKNWSGNRINNLSYKWLVDNNAVQSGNLELEAHEVKYADLKMPWSFDKSKIQIKIGTNAQSNSFSDSLEIFSDALSIGLYAEQTFYSSIGQMWEAWVRREINKLNDIMKNSIYEDTPDGVYDRFRLDSITIVEDNTINNPNIPTETDYSVDLVWGFNNSLADFVITSAADEPGSGSFIHELGHARYLIDVYAYNLTSDNNISITENGTDVAGSKFLPAVKSIIVNGKMQHTYHQTGYDGLMYFVQVKPWDYLDKYSAAAMNLMKGNRPIDGNYNGSGFEGYFMNDIPKNNFLKLKDQSGIPLSNAIVMVYQSTPVNFQINKIIYDKSFDDTADIIVNADQNGVANIGGNPFGDSVIHDSGQGMNSLIIIKVEINGRVGFKVVESALFNLEYWRGNSDNANYELTISMFGKSTGNIENKAEIPQEIKLMQNYPNPFNPTTTIEFVLSMGEKVSIKVYDSVGIEIENLVNQYFTAGKHKVKFSGDHLASGIYLYSLKAGEKIFVKKMLLLK